MQQRRDWTDFGVPVDEPPVTDVEAGIDRCISLFRTYRCFVFADLEDFREDLANYRREVDEFGNPTDQIANKGKFHRLDAFRYAVAGATDGRHFQPASAHIAKLFGYARKRLSS